MTIGSKLKLIRKKFQLKLEQTAAVFDITAQTLSRYENGKRTPDNEFLEAFGKHFNLSGNWLLYGEPPIFKTGEAKKDIRESFIELSHLVTSQKVRDMRLEERVQTSLDQLTGGSPENFLLMLEYMLKYPGIRKNMLQFFYIFQKPFAERYLSGVPGSIPSSGNARGKNSPGSFLLRDCL
jgi:transcriptional regulator with XRE-family HTH domain